MKVILLTAIPSVGKKHDIINVKDGYALNYLFPKKLAKPATANAEQEVLTMKKREVIRLEEVKAREAEIAEKLRALKSITFTKNASPKGQLFAAISEKEIIENLKTSAQVELESSHIALNAQVKTIGDHSITIRIGSLSIPFTIHVEQQGKK